MQSRLLCTATKVTLPTGEEFLVVDLAIDCPACGQGTLRLAGHHLRAIRDALNEMIDLHPTLTESEVQVLERLQVKGKAADPTVN